jgi:DNA-binding NarL/FixJ family response regulator
VTGLLNPTGLPPVRLAEAARTGDQLTAHELSIARLAGEGLTNREIGQRLYLSHRTVSTHLHRIFPNVSTRADLGTALRPETRHRCEVTYTDSVT